jgi:hypothetical protein
MKQYRPSISRQKKRYSVKLTLKRTRREQTSCRQPILSNREEWVTRPRSLSDAITIADEVALAAEGWRQG